MKKNEVKVGTVYRVKVSGSVQDVRITGENPNGGWDGLNVATKRKVRIKSPQRLRAVAGERPSKRKVIMSLAEYEAEAKADKKGQPKTAAAETPDASPAPKKRRQAKIDKPAKDRKPSGLDAAAQVLSEAGEPLNTKDMVERILSQGLWKTGGKTPSATIYAAIIREIAVKGADARFRKVERGKFELAK
jgi:hypothetical protein